MSEPYDGVVMSNCVECGKPVDLFDARKYQSNFIGSRKPISIDDTAYCEDCYYKAKCNGCGKEVGLSKQVVCSCHKYGGTHHEESVWCSEGCMEKAHDGPEQEAEEYQPA